MEENELITKTMDDGTVILTAKNGVIDSRRTVNNVWSEVQLWNPDDAKYFRPA